MNIIYNTVSGDILTFSIKGNAIPGEGEASLIVSERLDWRLYHVVGGVLTERTTPLPDLYAELRAQDEAYRQSRISVSNAIKNDVIMQTLLNKTPAEVFQEVELQVTDFASAKELLKRLAAICAFLLQSRNIE